MLDLTLDSPGSIAIIGGGPIGLEVAIYGRYLGYDVHLFEAGEIGQTLLDRPGVEMPGPLEQCCSPLGLAAIRTHDPDRLIPPMDQVLVAGMYRDYYLLPLAATDLLAGRVHLACPVRELELVEIESADAEEGVESEQENESELPSDFRLIVEPGSDRGEPLPFASPEGPVFESVVLAHGAEGRISLPPESAADDIADDPDRDIVTPVPYLFRVGCAVSSELSYLHGLEQTRRLFSRLTGRPQLDLYRLSHP